MTRYLSGLCVAGLGLCGGGWLVVAAVAFGGESAGRAEADRQQAEREQQAALVVGDGAVDDDLGDQRDDDLGAGGQHGSQQQQRQPVAVRAQVGMQPPEGGDWAGGHRLEPNWRPERCHLVFSVGN